eukprot:CAMPEP_0171208604 /NCGR_PEP_ID=MMETSP0790-20130122/28172_1 /TAXON_ID=2925 /ORGANISM="Alexandrium catenella, Strain OF101" /LENGTH=200 /DNA_ID=CAMNT_0011674201 /DNA_START=55 /DNA_END=657 /DNA_ORIENTATION=-
MAPLLLALAAVLAAGGSAMNLQTNRLQARVKADGSLSTGAREAAAAASGDRKQKDPTKMQEAVKYARRDVSPTINPKEPDMVWYSGDYAMDSNNPLLNLTLHSPATLPTPEQVAEVNAREEKAEKEKMTRAKAETAEAEKYYRGNYVFDKDNRLEHFTFTHYGPDENWPIPDATALGDLPDPPSVIAKLRSALHAAGDGS